MKLHSFFYDQTVRSAARGGARMKLQFLFRLLSISQFNGFKVSVTGYELRVAG